MPYSSVSGAIYAGRNKPEDMPSWVSDIPLYHWDTAPSSNTLLSLDPNANPSINPNYPADAEWNAGGVAAMMDVWCGSIYNHIDHELHIPIGGGHGDYAGNEPYRFSFNSDTPAWDMLRPPSGAIGNLLTTNDGQESTGLYSDGRFRAIHSYNKLCFVPNLGAVIPILGNTAWEANGANIGGVISLTTGEIVGGTWTGHPNSATHSGSGTCYDSSRHAVWYRGAGTGRFVRRNLTEQTWDEVGPSGAGSGYCALTYLEDWDCLLVAKNFDDTPSQLSIFDCTTGTRIPKTINGTLVGASSIGGGSQWHSVGSNEAAMWDNASNTTEVNKLTWTGNPRTATDFTVSQYPVAGTNSIIPTARTGNGTYGRFFHDPLWGIFGVVNAVNQPVYVYRYKAIGDL